MHLCRMCWDGVYGCVTVSPFLTVRLSNRVYIKPLQSLTASKQILLKQNFSNVYSSKACFHLGLLRLWNREPKVKLI